MISIHAPLTGSDLAVPIWDGDGVNFNPRSPYGERHPEKSASPPPSNFNPRSPYGERRCFFFDVVITNKFQSTLPLRGATARRWTRTLAVYNFNPRSPYGERQKVNKRLRFSGNFNPRSPYGERPGTKIPLITIMDFNPRSPYGERRHFALLFLQQYKFQSTLPLRGATQTIPEGWHISFISIHAPLTGSDQLPDPDG